MKIVDNRFVIGEGDNVGIEDSPSPHVLNVPQKRRDQIIIHAPESRSLDSTKATYLQPRSRTTRTGRSVHLLIDRDGSNFVQLVPFDKVASHSPEYNDSALGIELIYAGRMLEDPTAVGPRRKTAPGRGTEGDQFIYASSLNDSKFYYWPLFPKSQLDALYKAAETLRETYGLVDILACDEIQMVIHPGPAFPITQFREKLLGVTERSQVLQETAKSVSLLGQPGEENSLLSDAIVPSSAEVTIINEMHGWYLISVIDRRKDGPWMIGWVEKEAVRVRTNYIPVVRSDHRLATKEGRRFPEFQPHVNGFDVRRTQPEPRYIIMHFTSGTRMESTISHFKNPSSGVSTHLLIGRDGRVVQFLPFDRIAYHVGKGWWEGEGDLNNTSIGIELDNAGLLQKGSSGIWFRGKVEIPAISVKQAVHWKQIEPGEREKYPGWEDYPRVQLDMALKIIKAIRERYSSIKEILGHDDVTLNRYDPGPLFPIREFRKELFGREDPIINVYTITRDTDMYGNFNGRIPNTKQSPFDSKLPTNSEVRVKSIEDEFALVTVLRSKDPKLKVTGWIQSASLRPVSEGVGKDVKSKRKGGNLGEIRRTTFSQPIFRQAGGIPTPLLAEGPFNSGTKVRIQEVRGEWTLVALLDRVNGIGGLEGWMQTELLDPPVQASTEDLSTSLQTTRAGDELTETLPRSDISEELYLRSQAMFNDRAQGEDQLGIKDEVDALSEALLLRDVEPPVAVGVLGGWGSGKSFVMHLIRERVSGIRALKLNESKPVTGGTTKGGDGELAVPSYAGHIYQISFNAWTYAKSNLWASLMDAIFTDLNRQMQLERLLAYRNFSPQGDPPSRDQIRDSMLAGGTVFKMIYKDNLQIDRDIDLKQWRPNLIHWSQQLLKQTLLWNVLRGQQVETLKKLKDTEEQLNQLKSRREQFEKERVVDGISAKKLDGTARAAYFQSLKRYMLAFLSDQLSSIAKDELQKQYISDGDIQESLKKTEEKLKKEDASKEVIKLSLDKAKNELNKQHIREEEIQKFLKEARGVLGGVTTLFNAFRRSKLYLYWAIIFLALTFAVPYLWDRFALGFIRHGAAQAISSFIALFPIITAVLRWVRKSITAGLEAGKILEGAYITQQVKHAEEIANASNKPLPQKISELQADISQGSMAAYDALIGLLELQAEEQRQKIGPSAKYSNLMEFVQSRLDAATYENQLGLMHQVKQDIDELTFSLVDNYNSVDNYSLDVFPRGKPRVILYIDDLDRCPPSRVVEVLEAVLLLLNTKLFVVILGLDTRYVTRALEKEYKEILQHEGDPSGLDYIEKIIQIPYRVRSIDPDSLSNYIEKQMEIEKKPESPEEETTQSELPVVDQSRGEIMTGLKKDEPDREIIETASGALMDNTTGSPPESDRSESESMLVSKSVPEAKLEPGLPEPAKQEGEIAISDEQDLEQSIEASNEEPVEEDFPTDAIKFKQDDLEDLAACCHKVVLTPRSIKRLINIFKLMKIFWFRADKKAGLAERDRPRPVKQAAMCLLALSSAYPEVMREVFVHLEGLYRQRQEQTELFAEMSNIVLPSGSARELSFQLRKYKEDLTALKSITGAGQDNFGQLTLGDLRLSTFNIVRSFSFVGDPMYWTNEETEDKEERSG